MAPADPFAGLFSFLRGRLRTYRVETKKPHQYRFHSFEVGFGPTYEDPYDAVMCGFHSFEVGFGLKEKYKPRHATPCFHSFEVGFGPRKQKGFFAKCAGFHSFEVGFGLEEKEVTDYRTEVFIPSR